MTWKTIRDGVKTRLDTISGLSARDTAPASLPDKDTATVLPGEPVIAPAGHNGFMKVMFSVFVRCNRGKITDSQDALDDYITTTGASSIVQAIHGDRTLSGTVDDVRFVNVRGYGGVEGSQGVQAFIDFEAMTRL